MQSILMIDDNLEILNMYQTTFRHESFDFTTVQNGMDGIKLSLEKHPDLILLDLLMPGMDGISVMKIIREDNWGKNVPIIILTNMDTHDEISSVVMENEPTFCLIKANNEPSTVVAKVREILGKNNTN